MIPGKRNRTRGIRSVTWQFARDRDCFELRETEVLRGSVLITEYGARIAIADRDWELRTYRRRGRWYAVIFEPGTTDAEAEYYPAWRPGGTIAFADQRYRLALSPLTQRWRLRNEHRTTMAEFELRKWGRSERLVLETVRLPDVGVSDPNIWLVVLLSAWALMMEPRSVF